MQGGALCQDSKEKYQSCEDGRFELEEAASMLPGCIQVYSTCSYREATINPFPEEGRKDEVSKRDQVFPRDQAMKAKQKQYADAKQNIKPSSIAEGDSVLVKEEFHAISPKAFQSGEQEGLHDHCKVPRQRDNVKFVIL